jgi:hypothetical protein
MFKGQVWLFELERKGALNEELLFDEVEISVGGFWRYGLWASSR